MKLIDSKGRLFGKFSILDLGVALVILLVIIGIFVVPGTSGKSMLAQVQTKTIEVDAMVRGLNVLTPDDLLKEFKEDNKTNIVIRNQPAGQVQIVNVRQLARTIAVPQPDGTLKALADPRPDNFSQDFILTLGGKAEMTPTGAVIGNQKVKIGTVLELEGKSYNFNASVIALRIKS